MAARRVLIRFDDLTDVVSAYLADTRAVTIRPAPADGHVLLEVDAEGHVVGVEVAGASALVPSFWKTHPDRRAMPTEIVAELDRWLAHHWADQRSAR